MAGTIRPYPNDSVQGVLGSWWREDTSSTVVRGRLIWCLALHVDQVPNVLVPIGRTEATDHARADYVVEPFRVTAMHKKPKVPVAALPQHPGEHYVASRSKVRPALIVSTPTTPIDRTLTLGSPGWQTAPTLLVAPYYGTSHSGTRGGWSDQFVERVRRAEYPHFCWDLLPLSGEEESMLRLDHIQPIGNHHQAYRLTPYRLANEALEVIDDCIGWLHTGTFAEESPFLAVAELLHA